MYKINLITGLIWVGLGIIQCFGSIKLDLGNLHNPGPGLTPFLLGACLILLGCIFLISGIWNHLKNMEELPDKKTWERDDLKTALSALAVLFGYVFLFERLGFIISSFLFLFFLLKLKDSKRLMFPLLFSAIAVAISFLIFSVWLKTPLPAGIIKF